MDLRRASSAPLSWCRRRPARRSSARTTEGVNVELHPEYPAGYSCYNEAGEFYNAMISPDGRLLSLSGPVLLEPADS